MVVAYLKSNMSTAMDSLYEEVGIHCLYCGQRQLSPKENSDNWTCTHCYSGLISFRMLANLIPRELYQSITHSRGTKLEDRPCPCCHHALNKVEVERQGNRVALELCRSCRLFWFQGGGMVKLVKLAGSQTVMLPDPPKRGVRAPKKVQAPAEPESVVVPIFSVGLFLIFTFISAAALRYPEIYGYLQFLPSEPFRLFGLSWLTSLMLNPSTQATSLIVFLVFGIFCERRLGSRGYLELIFLVGFISRLCCVFAVTEYPQGVIGATPVTLALIAFGAFSFSYREYLFPDERWKSPVNFLSWCAIVGLMFFVVFGLLGIAGQAISGTLDLNNLSVSIPFFGALSISSLKAPYVLSLVAGAFWSLLRKA